MSDQLPPLPQSSRIFVDNDPAFDADQMHAYARAAQAMAYERAAQEIENAEHEEPAPGEWLDGWNAAAKIVRALAREAK